MTNRRQFLGSLLATPFIAEEIKDRLLWTPTKKLFIPSGKVLLSGTEVSYRFVFVAKILDNANYRYSLQQSTDGARWHDIVHLREEGVLSFHAPSANKTITVFAKKDQVPLGVRLNNNGWHNLSLGVAES